MNTMTMTSTIRRIIAASLIAALASTAPETGTAGAAPVSASCTRHVGPGSPTGTGLTTASPMSLPKLLAVVNTTGGTGVVACLTGGAYGSATVEHRITRGGSAAQPLTLRKSPTATTEPVISGRLVVARGADHVQLAGLTFVGPGAGTTSAFSLDANGIELVGNDFSSPNRICISVGGGIREVSPTLPKVTGFVADGDKVHDCGTNLARTGSPQAHGFYLEYSSGAIIRNNIVSNPAGRGVQLFNDADGSLIENNVFDGNFAAVNFGGGLGGSTSVTPMPENNVVRNNIVTNGVRWCNTRNQCQAALFIQGNHEAAYTSPPSSDARTKAPSSWGNVVRDNCVWFTNPTTAVTHNSWEPGYSYASSNSFVDPRYRNAAAGDFRLLPTSPCLGKGVRPTIGNATALATRTSATSSAVLRSPWMTATTRMQVRICAVGVVATATQACTGPWQSSPATSMVAGDVRVTASVSGLVPGRVYEYRWVTWQALLTDPGVPADSQSGASYWTASTPGKVATPA